MPEHLVYFHYHTHSGCLSVGMIDRKTEIQAIDGTPVKRIILSIISDYDLKTGLCELIDNAIDQWSDRGYSGGLTVDLMLDVERQMNPRLFIRSRRQTTHQATHQGTQQA